MPTFAEFNNRLPDPTFGVNDSGVVDAGGIKGPGYAGVRVQSNQDNDVSKTISGRGVHRSNGSQFWNISIKYNPMKREQFDVVDTFLQSRGARRKPFYVVLPQYAKPRDPSFAAFVATNTMRVALTTMAGSRSITMDASGTPIVGLPKPGDFFTISDPTNINHQKTYKVLFVETPTYYQNGTTAPPANSIRVHTNPEIQRNVTLSSLVRWIDPKFRVMMKGDIIEHELDTEGLFEFGLELEEVQP